MLSKSLLTEFQGKTVSVQFEDGYSIRGDVLQIEQNKIILSTRFGKWIVKGNFIKIQEVNGK